MQGCRRQRAKGPTSPLLSWPSAQAPWIPPQRHGIKGIKLTYLEKVPGPGAHHPQLWPTPNSAPPVGRLHL